MLEAEERTSEARPASMKKDSSPSPSRRRKPFVLRKLAKLWTLLSDGCRSESKKSPRNKQYSGKHPFSRSRERLTVDFFHGNTDRYYCFNAEDDDETVSSSTISPTNSSGSHIIQDICLEGFAEPLPLIAEEEEEEEVAAVPVLGRERSSPEEEKVEHKPQSVEQGKDPREAAISSRASASSKTQPTSSASETGSSNVVFSNIYALIDALVKDENHESIKDKDGDNRDNVGEDTRSVHTKSSVFSSSNFSTVIGVFDDGSVTTAGGGGLRHNQKHNRIPFHAVHKRTTPNLVRRRRYTLRHGGGGRLEERFDNPSTFSPNPASTASRRVTWASKDLVVDEYDNGAFETSWNEFEQQASGDIYAMVDEGLAATRLSNHVLSPEPKVKRQMVEL